MPTPPLRSQSYIPTSPPPKYIPPSSLLPFLQISPCQVFPAASALLHKESCLCSVIFHRRGTYPILETRPENVRHNTGTRSACKSGESAEGWIGIGSGCGAFSMEREVGGCGGGEGG
ncbi:hypothetical protein P154DRAFT_261880 [Amniculicola lignicola CBS 123094]|uniref:Uncharacterized protein n=1 Tax=Amniculicola lignicola CBS 123094 TaxID=1392246 RepID=A0A6A5WDS5_9PLEO|nr:hypothetical protein P154DRAFT_261880 [Amniculicola lignicola CBS 123094]